jgi:hypothetical protein
VGVLIRDYFAINWRRVRKDLLIVLVGGVLLNIGLLLRSLVPFGNELFAIRFIAITSVTLVLLAIAVFVAHFFLAYSIVWALARKAQLSVGDYMSSHRYQNEARPKLKQDEGRKLW